MTPRQAGLSTADRLAAPISEAELQNWIFGLCKALGVRFYHTKDSRRSPKGFPDLTLLGASGLLFRELKTSKGKVTVEQQGWLDDLAATGHNAGVWRSVDWVTGRIQTELKMIAKRRPARAAPTTWRALDHDDVQPRRSGEHPPRPQGPEAVPRRPLQERV
jgi:hypothetical protein